MKLTINLILILVIILIENSIFVEHNLSVSGQPVKYIRNHVRHLIREVPFYTFTVSSREIITRLKRGHLQTSVA